MSNEFSNKGMIILGAAFIVLYGICAFLFRVDLSNGMIFGFGIPVIGAAIACFTNTEQPPQPLRIWGPVAIFAICLIVILAAGSAHRSDVSQGLK